MTEKIEKRKINAYFSTVENKKEKESLKEDLTLFLEKVLMKKGETLVELIVILTLLSVLYYFIFL